MSRDKPLISVWGVPGGRGERVPCNPSRGRPLTDSQKKKEAERQRRKEREKRNPPAFRLYIRARARYIISRRGSPKNSPLSLSLRRVISTESATVSLSLPLFGRVPELFPPRKGLMLLPLCAFYLLPRVGRYKRARTGYCNKCNLT